MCAYTVHADELENTFVLTGVPRAGRGRRGCRLTSDVRRKCRLVHATLVKQLGVGVCSEQGRHTCLAPFDSSIHQSGDAIDVLHQVRDGGRGGMAAACDDFEA